jgi:hypothetical protein
MSKPLSEDLRLTTRITAERTIEAFTTEPRLRIRRGHNITIRRCYEVAKHLWQCGIRDKATREELENAIFYCVGGDHRTANRYIGRWLFSRPVKSGGVIVDPARKIKYVKGYLERLHFIESSGLGKYELNFGAVPGVSANEVSGMGSNPVLCVFEHGAVVGGREERMGTTTDINDYIITTTHNTHTNQLGESNQNRVVARGRQADLILHAKACVEPDRSKGSMGRQPFKLRFEER